MMLLLSLTRGYLRHPVHKIASYDYGGKRFLTVTLDLGLGGMRIKTHDRLPVDEYLSFKLVLGKDSIWLKGRVVHSGFLSDKQSVSDVQFMELSAQDHTVLQNYLATLQGFPRPRGMLSAGDREGDRIASRKRVEE